LVSFFGVWVGFIFRRLGWFHFLASGLVSFSGVWVGFIFWRLDRFHFPASGLVSFFGVWIGVDIRMGLVQGFGEFSFKGLGVFSVFVMLPRPVVKMTLPLDVAVLEVIGPSSDLTGTAFGQGYEI
jgi:hypothetical protein